MNQVDKELMQEKGILTENEKADEYEIQKAAMKEAVFFLAAMLEKNLDMSELQTISLYLKELSMKQHYMHIHLYVQQLYLYEYCGLVEKSPDIATEVNEKESAANHKEVQVEGSFANIKEDMEFRRYLYRRKANVTAQSILLAIGYNINKLHHKIQAGRTGRHLFPLKQTA